MTPLEDARERALSEIDNAAGTARLRFTTVAYGQEQVYIEKTNEALDFVAEKYPLDLSAFPLIEADVEATGLEPQIVANIILQKRSEWIKKVAVIEKHRRKGKIAILSAPSIMIINEIKIQYVEFLRTLS